MDLSSLKPAAGATKARKRVGRGTGSGLGNTSTRGTKGAKSRSGYSKKFGFEGGQNPLQRRLPKVGFNSPNRREYTIISLSDLAQLAEQKGLTEITPEELVAAGLVQVVGRAKRNLFPVVERETDKLLGVVSLDDIRNIMFRP